MGIKATLKEALTTKSGIASIIILVPLISLSIAVPFFVPLQEAKQWTNTKKWQGNPRLAKPIWVDWFTEGKTPRNTFVTNEDFDNVSIEVGKMKKVILKAELDYRYDGFPSELRLYLDPKVREASMKVDVTWGRPDGAKIGIYSGFLKEKRDLFNDPKTIESIRRYIREHSEGYPKEVRPEVALFAKKGKSMSDPSTSPVLKGKYNLRVEATSWGEKDNLSSLRAEFRAYGRIYGLMGTDSSRRDLSIGLLWGTPIELAFSIIAAVAITLIQTIFGAAGALYGGKMDEVVQRSSELLMILPPLVVLVLLGYFYGIGIWKILFVLIVMSIVGPISKVVRGVVLQAKEELYVEAARSYGASNRRILFRYMVPKALPYTFALMAMGVPTYIFLEAALSFLGLGDPRLPTWGRILSESFHGGAGYHGFWWWIASPIALILLTASAFILLGYSFDRVVAPRLREVR